MCLGCFVESSKLKLLCVHSWKFCITVLGMPDCYYIRHPQIHSWALSQVPNSISERWNTPTTFILPPECLNSASSSLCLLQTLPAHSFHMWQQHLPEKTTFLSCTLKGIKRLKNYCRNKTILAFKMWWQPTNGQEIKHQGGKLQLYSVGTCKYLLLKLGNTCKRWESLLGIFYLYSLRSQSCHHTTLTSSWTHHIWKTMIFLCCGKAWNVKSHPHPNRIPQTFWQEKFIM